MGANTKSEDRPLDGSELETKNTGTPSQAELSRHALELKLANQAHQQYPGAGRSASEGMRPKQRQEPVKVGTTRKEIGRVSQAVKVAQARKDARDG